MIFSHTAGVVKSRLRAEIFPALTFDVACRPGGAAKITAALTVSNFVNFQNAGAIKGARKKKLPRLEKVLDLCRN
jgi:hypothetical protein